MALLAAVVIAWLGTASPHPRGADAAAGDFSAARAFEDNKVIAARPHPIGSDAKGKDRLWNTVSPDVPERTQTRG